VVAAAALLLLAGDARVNADRSAGFAPAPTRPFASIAGFGRGSLPLPDLGGTLFTTTRLRLVELAGLCDRTGARTLTDDTSSFRRYVFEDVRSTFIQVHGSWAGWAALHQDPRLLRDPAPLHETWQSGES
jgi:hypothetical protein